MHSKFKIHHSKLFLAFFLLPFALSNAQELNLDDLSPRNPNTFDYSKRFYPSIEVNLWGTVKSTGIYKVNEGTNLLELLSYSGGLLEDAQLDELRILRFKNDSLGVAEDQILIVNYEEIYEKEQLTETDRKMIELYNGDIVVVPRATSWLEDIAPVTRIISLLTSLATLVYLIIRLN